MKSRALLAVLFLTVLTAIPTMASAAYLHYFECEQCHKAGTNWTTISASGVCVSCHSDARVGEAITFPATRPDGANSKPVNFGFSTGDASNAFGSNPTVLPASAQNSHNWGAVDRNLAAGATPASSAMYNSRRGKANGIVTCYKCHDPHASYDADYLTGQEKMLRTTVIGDGTSTNSEQNVEAMCVECHKDWAAVGAGENALLSHPTTSADYNATYASDPRFKTGVDYTPPGDMALMADGSIGCSTCHGLHSTDSGGTNDGKLLKADPTAAIGAGEICTSCHTYEAHSTGEPLACLVCHSGHSYNENNDPNYFVLRSEVDTTTFGPKTGLLYTDLGATTAVLYAGTTGDNGYCTGCHGPIAGENTGEPSAGSMKHTGSEVCTECHKHFDTTTSGSFTATGCNTCHGYAPSSDVAGGNFGYAVNSATGNDYKTPVATNPTAPIAPKNEALTAHLKHSDLLDVGTDNYKLACIECHSAYPGSHKDDSYQDVSFGALASNGGLIPTAYAPAGNGTCATIYCHSNGRASGATAATIPSWQSGGNTLCSSCHDDNTSNIGAGTKGNTAAHAAHVTRYDAVAGPGSSCNICHSDTTDGLIIDTKANHVNGSVQLATDADFVIDTVSGATLGGGSLSGTGTCSVYCHSDGAGDVKTPAWTDGPPAAACGACHSVNPSIIDFKQGGGAHVAHLSDPFGPAIATCNVCHEHAGEFTPNNGHIDGFKTVKANACDACHGKGAGWGATGSVDESPVWTDPTTVRCVTCHSGTVGNVGGPAPLVAEGAYANGHGKTTAASCTSCHEAATVAGHLGGATVTRLNAAHPAYVAGNDVAFCTNCHSATTNNHSAIDGTVCKTCHAQHGEANGFDAMIKSVIAGNAVTGFATQGSRTSYVNAARTGICQTCHDNTIGYFNSVLAFNDAGHNPGQSCSVCHTHDSTPKAFAGAGNACDACHGFPPATAAHELHAPDSALLGSPVLIGIDRSSCENCHTGASSYTYSPSDDQLAGGARGNHNVSEASQDATLLASVGYTGSNCTSACHDGASGVTAIWTDTSLACDACHYQAADPTQAANTSNANTVSAGHNAHFAGGGAVVCTDCHNAVAAADTTHITDRSGLTEILKVQGMATAVQAEALVIAGAGFNTVTDSCATASCHNDARPGASVATSAWGTNDANCTQCHAASPTTGSHVKHIPDAADCSTCHTGALQGTSYINANHFDNNVDVAVGSYPTNKAINSAFTSCTTANCHDDGRSANTTPNWGTAAADSCVACHDAIPATGSHASHVADAAVACANCHTGAVQSTTAPTANHRDGNVNAVSYAVQPKGSAYANCSNASCHNDGRNSGVTQTWGTTVNNCAECHATTPGTGGHEAHIGVNFGGSTITCGVCHTGSVEGTTAPTANHRDGNVNANGYPVQVNGSAFTTCASASCHQTGQAPTAYTTTPTWGSDVANCTQCHLAAPTTGSHTKHLASSVCSTCHTNALKDVSYIDAAHGDGNIDVAVGSYPLNKTKGAAYTTCASISCHSDGFSGASGSTPVWGVASGCAACHLDDMTRGSHTAHLADNNACNTCHGDTVKATTAPTGVHANANVDVYDVAAGDLGYPTTAAYGAGSWSTCSAASCHDAGREANLTSTWGTTISDCTECHSAAAISTGSHAVHIADGATCANCHDAATNPATETAPASGHRDNNIDVTAGTYPTNKAKGSLFTNCTTASCHDDGRGSAVTGVWGTARANCGECHAVAPITGSHTTHLADAAVDCINCHAAAVEGTTAPSTGHRDGDIDVDGTGYTLNKGLGTGFTTCATATCHDTGRNSSGLTGTWGTPLGQCAECHAVAPATGSHTRHLSHFACATCHTGVTQGTTAGAGHRDGNITTAASTGLGVKVKGTSYISCGTNNCHGSGSPVWGTNLLASDQCTKCHGQLVAAGTATEAQKAPGGAGVDTNGDSAATDAQVGAHQIHLNPTKSKAVACIACHIVPATPTAAGHIDSALPAELTWGSTAIANSTTPTSCATTYCHDGAAIKNGYDGGTLAPVWTNTAFMQGTVADCDNCHGYPPAGGHVANTDCSACHDVMNADDLTFTAAGKLSHVDGVVQASGGDNCIDCHSTLNAGHDKHTNESLILGSATLSVEGYGGLANWYTATYVSGKPVFGCGFCHPKAATDHIGGSPTVNLAWNDTGATGSLKANNGDSAAYAGAGGGCSQIYCHSDGNATANRVYGWSATPNWSGGTLPTDGSECASCHGNSPTTNAHSSHEVGIHFDELYDDDGAGLMAATPDDLGVSGGADSAHGNSLTSSTISCVTCHKDTVSATSNAMNTTCNSCHSDTDSPLQGDETAKILITSTTHLNGVKDVSFADLTVFKSKAQLRDDLIDADDGSNVLSALWDRLVGNYKKTDGSGFDQGKVAATAYVGDGTCSTIVCHNGNTATWTDVAVDCTYCHTSLPK